MKFSRFFLTIGLVGCLLALPLVEARAAQRAQSRPDPASVKQCLKQLGEDAKVTVKLANGAKREGRLGSVGEKKFQLRRHRSDFPRNIDYNQVVGLNRTEFDDSGPPPPACAPFAALWPHSEWDNLRQLRIGNKVEVVQHNLSKHKGTVQAWTEETISLRLKNQDVTIPREEVYRVTQLSRTRRGRNATIGLGLGALVGAVGGAFLAKNIGPDSGLVFVFATAISGGVGAGVGAAFPSHPTIYRVPRKKPEDGR